MKHLAALFVLLFLGLAVQAQTDLSRGLVAYFPFDGNTTDASPTHAKASLVGTCEFQQGISGSCLVLNGQGYVRVEDAPALNCANFTLSAWVCRYPANNNARVLEKGSGHSYWLYLFGGKVVGGFFGEDSVDCLAPRAVPVKEWTHVCSTYDGATLCVYVNGNLESSTAVKDPVATTSRPLFIGTRGGKSDNWIGGIDEVRIYNRALSAEEVAALAKPGAN